MDGDCYEGKEDHVWMDIKPFENYQEGDCLSFGGEIYRYLKTRNGKQISFGIRVPYDISKIETYELPTDEELADQSINMIICETCYLGEQCNRGICLRPKKEINQLRQKMKKMVVGGEIE